MKPVTRLLIPLLILVAAAVTAWWIRDLDDYGRDPALILILGFLFGVVLQRSRFCFFCRLREWLQDGDARGVLAILLALAVGLIGYSTLTSTWVLDPSSGRLPPDAHIGPVSWVVALAGLVFGVGMTFAGSCISAQLYRLGEGSPLAVLALIGCVPGFLLGFWSWNSFHSLAIAEAPTVWLPQHLGHAGALLLQLAVLAAFALYLMRHLPAQAPLKPIRNLRDLHQRLFSDRWPAWWGGLGVGLIGIVAYFRTSPLGVTAEIGSRARTLGNHLGWLPERLEGLDSFSGCATRVIEVLMTPNGIFILALVAGGFAAALAAGQFQPVKPSKRKAVAALVGGVLMGWAAMIGLGCTVGVLLSGISAGALSGWVFALALVVGVRLTLPFRKRYIGPW